MRLARLHINLILSILCLTLFLGSSFSVNESEKEIEQEIESLEFYAPDVDLDFHFVSKPFSFFIIPVVKSSEALTNITHDSQRIIRQLFILYQCLKLEYSFS